MTTITHSNSAALEAYETQEHRSSLANEPTMLWMTVSSIAVGSNGTAASSVTFTGFTLEVNWDKELPRIRPERRKRFAASDDGAEESLHLLRHDFVRGHHSYRQK